MSGISVTEIESLARTALSRAGMREAEIALLLDHMIYNERADKKSHGFIRLEGFIKALRKGGAATEDPMLVLDLPSLAIVDGQRNIGMAAVSFGADVAIRKAKENGIAFVGIRNFRENTGTLNYYLHRIVEAGLAGIAGCNSYPCVCPPGGHTPVIGTNPIGFGIPARGTPFIADLTSAAMAYGKIMVLQREGKPVPPGVLVDAQGRPSTDPKDAFTGAQLPMAGHKGFALGLAVELLSGPLLGQSAGKRPLGEGDGFFFIVIDPEHLGGAEAVKTLVEEKLAEIRGSGKTEGTEDILIPGDRSAKALKAAQTQDTVEILDEVYKTMQRLAEG